MVRVKFSVVWRHSIRFMQAGGRERNMVVCAASEKMFCDRRNSNRQGSDKQEYIYMNKVEKRIGKERAVFD